MAVHDFVQSNRWETAHTNVRFFIVFIFINVMIKL